MLFLAQCSPATPEGASAADNAAAPQPKEKSFAEEEAAKKADRRNAAQKSVDLGLLGSGFFQVVRDKEEQAEEILKMEKAFRGMGIAAAIKDCSWMGVLADGNASGSYYYGAVCKVRIGDKPPETFILCNEKYAGTTISKPDGFGASDDDLELIMRRLCLNKAFRGDGEPSDQHSTTFTASPPRLVSL
jgi:hypothetical protein